MRPPEDAASLRSRIATLQAELDSLRAEYNSLKEINGRAAERYKADYKKWRAFKEWLFGDTAETDDHVKAFLESSELEAHIKASVLGKRKLVREFGMKSEDAGEDDHKTKRLGLTPNSSPHSASTAVTHKQRRKSYHGESSHKTCSSSSSGGTDPFLVPQSTKPKDGSSGSHDSSAMAPCKAESSRPISLTEPRKGRGRYAQARPGVGTINSKFSIRKDRNEGVDFQYDAIVRNRQERKHMLGSDCECCHEYYKAVGPLPASRQPLWRTPTKCKIPQDLHMSDDDKENSDEMEQHKQLISRHRHHWHRPKTPPGYWDIGFPSTPEVLDINRRAAEMHKRKLIEVETEAKNSNGRYVERPPITP